MRKFRATPEKVQGGPDILEDLRSVVSSHMQHCYNIRWNLKVNTRCCAKELPNLLYCWQGRALYEQNKATVSHFGLEVAIPREAVLSAYVISLP